MAGQPTRTPLLLHRPQTNRVLRCANRLRGMFAPPALPVRAQVALRMCSSAGEGCRARLVTDGRVHFGCEIIDGIGSTEMLHIFSFPTVPAMSAMERPASRCRATWSKLRDETGHVLTGSEEVGDLYISGPSSALMYWTQREKSNETFRGSWIQGLQVFPATPTATTYAGRKAMTCSR